MRHLPWQWTPARMSSWPAKHTRQPDFRSSTLCRKAAPITAWPTDLLPRSRRTARQFVTSSYIGGAQKLTLAYGVAWNSVNGNVYVTGGTQSPNLPVTAGAYQPQCGTDGNCNEIKGAYLDDAFVGRLQSTRSTSAYVYLTYLGGGGVDDGSPSPPTAPGTRT